MNRTLPTGTQFHDSVLGGILREGQTAFDLIAEKDRRIAELEAEVAALKAKKK